MLVFVPAFDLCTTGTKKVHKMSNAKRIFLKRKYETDYHCDIEEKYCLFLPFQSVYFPDLYLRKI